MIRGSMLLRFLASGLACTGVEVENARIEGVVMGRRDLGETWWNSGVRRR